MGKAPADQFYFMDYIRDTRSLSLEAKGAWMDILAHGFFNVPQGRISQDLDAWSRMLGCPVDTARTVLEQIGKHRVGDVETERNGDVTVTNRRQFNAWQEREANKHRVADYRERKKAANSTGGNGECNADVQKRNSASSSSSSTSQKEVSYDTSKKPPPRGEPPLREIFVGKILTAIEKRLGVKKLPGRATWMQHAEWAFENDFTEEIFLECFDLLSQQKWRDGPVKPEHITQHLPIMGKLRNEIAKQNGASQKPNSSGGRPSAGQTIANRPYRRNTGGQANGDG